ncbi:choice-of-anchor D domain-containing protein [Mangrovimonas sp. ST2L15]|uniref:choice-of-anchor D domain-containing protein n=1 Tax=Mangrovimonas sp. ST2L15 TaxID=1645916 RepID=UPI0006B5A401|nr:choice-of-anchor D domain-containing protein [Mangrovimonas sp. ST2L15]
MIKKYTLLFFIFLSALNIGFGQVTIGIQDFETSPATPTMTYTGGSIATGTGPFPAGDNNFVSGSSSIEVNNGSDTITFSSVDASSYSNIYFTCRLASFSATSGNGADGSDEVYFEISEDNGVTWSQEIEVQGNNNAIWSFDTGTGTSLTTYDGDNNATIYTPSGGGYRTTDGYSTIVIDGLPNSNELRVRIIMTNNSANEYWIVDDAEIIGTSASPCSAPTNQPTNLTFSGITGSTIDGDFTATTADEYLVVVSTSSTLGANPVNGTTYSAGDTIGSGTVVQGSNATTFSATGLSQITQYYFFVFAYNDSSCTGGPDYNTTNPLTGDETTITDPCLNTGFESGQPTGWTNNGSYFNTGNPHSGYQKAGMNDEDDWISTSMVTDPNTLSFWARTSGTGSNFTVNVQYSDDGISWYDASIIIANGSNTGDVTTNYQLFSINLNLSNDYYIRWYMSNRSSGSFYFDDVELTCGGTTPAPELQLVDDTSTNQNCGYTIDFGSQALSTNTNITFAIENIGSADLDITSLGITGNYTVSPTGLITISAGNSQTFTVTFTPTTNGTQNGTITINNNDPNEGSCTINLTGEGFTPAPEIDIERNTGGTIPNGSSPNIGYNTIFAATVMGDSSSPKTFHVSNEGTSDLDLTSITSSNPTEFSISLNPSPSTISSNTEVDFEIVFSPTGVGLRTSTITIISNDSDENPYTFQVQGNGDCAASPITISPMSGPEATIINITGINFGSATTATLNGVSISSVNVISSTELELSVPSGATTGSLEITNDLGCLSSELFIVIDNQISSCEGNSGISPTELFISEVTDHGTGHHSYVEIFNGTGATVNLSGYEIRIHNNGASTATSSVTLSGSIINGDVFVLAFGQSDATDAHASHGFDQSSNVNGINEDDHIRLYNGTTWIDLWGDTSGDSFTIASKNYTYRRKNTGIIAPSTTWNSNDWDSFSPVDYTDIGTFDFSTGVPPSITSGPTINQSCNTATISVAADEGYSGGNSLAYQWCYLAPGNSGWTEITDDATFNNSDTAILEILDIFPVVDYQFYCQIREDDQTCFTASNAVLLELDSVTWDGSSWSPSNPTSNTIAIINGDYDTSTSGSFVACNLLINPNYSLDIDNGYYVSVVNDIIVDGEIYVAPQGSLVQIQDSGTFTLNNTSAKNTMSKLTAPLQYWYDYTYWSSPLENGQIETALIDANPNRRFSYNASLFNDDLIEDGNSNTFITGQDDIDDNGDDWVVQSTGQMVPGSGYAATHNVIGFIPGNQYQYIFEGTQSDGGAFNTGNIDVNIYIDNTVIYNNWNLIGNPYPCAIDALEFFNHNSTILEGVLYLWSSDTDVSSGNSGNEGLNFSQNDYAMINGSGGIASSNGSDIPEDFVPSGQGFFVIGKKTGATSGPGYYSSTVFNNAMRVTGNNSQFFRATTNNNNRLWINLSSDNGAFNQILVGYFQNASDDYDGMYYDAPRNMSTGQNALLYSLIENIDSKFAIQGKSDLSLDINEVIPLGFSTTIYTPTIYTLSLAQIEGQFLNSNIIYLKDNLLNIYHDLSSSDYTFSSEQGEFNDRFEIVFQTNALSTSESVLDTNDLTIVELQNGMVSFTVGKNKTIEKIEIYDLLGRSLLTFIGSSSKEVLDLSSLSCSAYLAKITLNNDQEITKKAIKR